MRGRFLFISGFEQIFPNLLGSLHTPVNMVVQIILKIKGRHRLLGIHRKTHVGRVVLAIKADNPVNNR